jgi:PncC family amidohydrolase
LIEQGSSLEEAVYLALRDRGWKIATAESCTAGGLSARIASIPGASDVLSGGVVAYQEHVKQSLLGVPEELLEQHGAVSFEVTESMAQGVQALFGVEVVCAVSGYFGPTGGTPTAPIGTVCASFIFPHATFSERFLFQGTRESICERTIQTLLAKLLLAIQKNERIG